MLFSFQIHNKQLNKTSYLCLGERQHIIIFRNFFNSHPVKHLRFIQTYSMIFLQQRVLRGRKKWLPLAQKRLQDLGHVWTTTAILLLDVDCVGWPPYTNNCTKSCQRYAFNSIKKKEVHLVSKENISRISGKENINNYSQNPFRSRNYKQKGDR